MLKRVTWRSWAALSVALGAYVGLGFAYGGNGHAATEAAIYKWGLLAGALAPLVFVTVYAASGAKPWRNDVGAALIQSALCMIPIAGPLAYVLWVDHGMLTTSLLAWIEVSGPVLSAAAMLRLCWVVMRIQRHGKSGDGDGAT